MRRDGVLFFLSLLSFLRNTEITRGSLLEKNVDVTKYFKKSNDQLDGRVLSYFVPCSSTSSVLSAAREMNSVQEGQDLKKKRQVLPEVQKTWLTSHRNIEIQKLGDGLQRNTQITPLKERLLETGR